MRKLNSLFLSLVACAPLASAASTYIGPVSGTYATATNWDTGVVPATATGEATTISNGATVDYNGTTLGDMNVNGGGSITVSGGSILTTSQSNWAQINNGSLVLNSGTYKRTASGNLVVGFASGTAGSPTTGMITMTNGSSIQMTSGSGNLVLGAAGGTATSFTKSTLNLTDSSITLAGELWMGGNSTTDNNQVVDVNINNSSITSTTTGVGFWVWDYDATGSSMHINFTGAVGSSITVADSIGSRGAVSGQTNAATWESLWSAGILTAQGQSGLTGATFTDYFTTSGTSARDGGSYKLTLVPEPSGAVMAGLAAGALILRRRRRA